MGPRTGVDRFGRPLRNLRLSVTDRCNLRCAYCMPEEEYRWLPREDLLHFEEIAVLVDAFCDLGVRRIRLTGGEPLLRREADKLVAMLAARKTVEDLAITTNGLLLAEQAAALHAAGLHRVTVSLDTLRPDRFRALARRDAHADVLSGLRASVDAGFRGTKIDTVVMRGVNDDELCALVAFGREIGAEVRFIEYMDVGGATRWSMDRVVPRTEMLAHIEAQLGRAESLADGGCAPAARFRLGDGTTFGIISSTTAPFCQTCDRSRLTADGMWLLCLYATNGTDLRGPLRAGAGTAEIQRIVTEGWRGRQDRGAEDRLAAARREPLAPPQRSAGTLTWRCTRGAAERLPFSAAMERGHRFSPTPECYDPRM